MSIKAQPDLKKGISSFTKLLAWLMVLLALTLLFNVLVVSPSSQTISHFQQPVSQFPSATPTSIPSPIEQMTGGETRAHQVYLPMVMGGTSPTDPTEGWKEYVDGRYDYSILYPSNWFVEPTAKEGYGAVATFFNYDPEKSNKKMALLKT